MTQSKKPRPPGGHTTEGLEVREDRPRPDPPDAEREARCAKLLAELRRLCPDLVPATSPPRKPGEVAEPVALTPRQLDELFREALQRDPGSDVVVWRDGDSEAVLHPGRTRVAAQDGILGVALLLETQQSGAQEVVVPFALGSPDQPAGMIVATEQRPRGQAVLVDRWGEAIIAAAFEALLDIADVAAARAGTDLDGVPLRAGALTATGKGLAVLPQARHDFERQARA